MKRHVLMFFHFRFLRTAEDDSKDSWEVNLAKRYYAKLFKEYAIGDLSRYKVGRAVAQQMVCMVCQASSALWANAVLITSPMWCFDIGELFWAECKY